MENSSFLGWRKDREKERDVKRALTYYTLLLHLPFVSREMEREEEEEEEVVVSLELPKSIS